MTQLKAFPLGPWIDAHRADLLPPVGNKRLFREGDFVIMVVGGPNQRKDFHLDPGEEFFYQLEGDMLLKVVEKGRVVDVPIREGEVLLLPAHMPHSPRRYANTVGLVIERVRRPGERDGLAWYCENCNAELYREEFELTDIETQFPPVFDRFYSSLERRTCKRCKAVQNPSTLAPAS
ncbi:MAG TPA: 3-hydroxyanthranilate 3,4-dioxygenase [Steroidobacteraceae bacterium]|nr:3-hydroxyanthranilate 3,4-dioxygenase [Steroidobacteraceae bacterium]HQX47863.1 3-hydroxyanthranilate 3,4-dioxygenase [Steroidobacteraceae bacterium]HQX78048.1 3-hydroxyanthranilate 3,4-dioxygenase [Steroidobacteraceae bacterium]HQZ79449.1 3-hydroxyanthranilate 3,4-dioxygenase [Steroidobacteraceae bacterium]